MNLNERFEVSEQQKEFYKRNKFIKLKQVFNEEILRYYEKEITAEVNRINSQPVPLEERDTYGKAFLQIFNLWLENNEIKDFVLSKRLGGIAADLMEVDRVRIYHDQALFKEGGGGITPWHADQYYWPLDTSKTITAWIPLQETPLEMGPLEFAAGSDKIEEGRDLNISDDSERRIEKNLRINNFKHVIEAFDLGEVSFHSGWVFHRAGANKTDRTRKVMTVIFMDAETRLMAPKNENQKLDWERWCPGAKVGRVIDSPLNPVI
ncbi:MAG TPA: phytanoyl-CoA dioxygenase family protein [Salinimicrobium sp.]|nr:phytanoyl-CoA dioxygenase family protein [Salinimicrobium sp.]